MSAKKEEKIIIKKGMRVFYCGKCSAKTPCILAAIFNEIPTKDAYGKDNLKYQFNPICPYMSAEANWILQWEGQIS